MYVHINKILMQELHNRSSYHIITLKIVCSLFQIHLFKLKLKFYTSNNS